jgi:hypothetical protein
MSHPLKPLFNLSFSTGVVPKQMQISKVVPIFKSGEATSPLSSNVAVLKNE